MNPIIKKSFGFVVCRRNVKTRQWEVLTVRKRNSYAFVEFLLKKHDRKDEKSILMLLNNMTYDEKIDVLSLNFGQMWHRFLLMNPDSPVSGAGSGQGNAVMDNYEKYKARKANFEKTFTIDKGKLLRRLLEKSRDSINTWEFPKGRRNGSEKKLNCAIRETSEEAGLFPTDYRILDESPLSIIQHGPGVKYESYYYIAVMSDHNYKPKLPERMKAGKPSEIVELQWMTSDKINIIDTNNKMTDVANTALKIVKIKYGYNKILDLGLVI
jgi:8-oxo-dGTP pyrophosphatase MutT (NUDIX family)